MQQHANRLASSLQPEIRRYLELCGLSSAQMSKCDANTRLWQNLGLYGEEAEAYMEVLAREYGVNMEEFEFPRFFPSEFAGKNTFIKFIISSIPFLGTYMRSSKSYHPITLSMIASAIEAKRWIFKDGR